MDALIRGCIIITTERVALGPYFWVNKSFARFFFILTITVCFKEMQKERSAPAIDWKLLLLRVHCGSYFASLVMLSALEGAFFLNYELLRRFVSICDCHYL